MVLLLSSEIVVCNYNQCDFVPDKFCIYLMADNYLSAEFVGEE